MPCGRFGSVEVASMIAKVFDAVFGCRHSQYSFPMTIRGGRRNSTAAAATGTYVVCIECGKEMPYDWQSMKLVSGEEMAAGQVALATKEAA
jgi:hypothetical protein